MLNPNNYQNNNTHQVVAIFELLELTQQKLQGIDGMIRSNTITDDFRAHLIEVYQQLLEIYKKLEEIHINYGII